MKCAIWCMGAMGLCCILACGGAGQKPAVVTAITTKSEEPKESGRSFKVKRGFNHTVLVEVDPALDDEFKVQSMKSEGEYIDVTLTAGQAVRSRRSVSYSYHDKADVKLGSSSAQMPKVEPGEKAQIRVYMGMSNASKITRLKLHQ